MKNTPDHHEQISATLRELNRAIGLAMELRETLRSECLMEIIAGHFGISASDIVGTRRLSRYADARCIYARIMRGEGMLLRDIGSALKRDHSSVIHLLARFDTYNNLYHDFQDHYRAIERQYKCA